MPVITSSPYFGMAFSQKGQVVRNTQQPRSTETGTALQDVLLMGVKAQPESVQIATLFQVLDALKGKVAQKDLQALYVQLTDIIQQEKPGSDLLGRIASHLDSSKITLKPAVEAQLLEKLAGTGKGQDQDGSTDLMQAAYFGKTDAAQMQINAGTDVNAKDKNGSTALMYAAYAGKADTIQLLIKAGADVNLQNGKGSIAMMYAAAKGHTQAIQLLVKAGANVNLQDAYGNTTLMEAVQSGSKEMVKVLIQAGADVNLKNDRGHTALELAKNEKRRDIVGLLKSPTQSRLNSWRKRG